MESHFQILEEKEEEGSYSGHALVEKIIQKTRNVDLNLKEGEHFRQPILQKFDRKNIIYYGVFTQELPIDIKSTNGTFVLPLVNRKEIESKICSIKNPEHRKKIGWIQIATVQVLLRSTFKEGIGSPIKLVAYDRRIRDSTKDSILGGTRGNLAYKTLKFNIGVKYAINIKTKNLDKSICIGYKFDREELMEKGDSPFSLTYQVEYALTNSHHSIQFKNQEAIYLDKLFKDIVEITTPKIELIEQKDAIFPQIEPLALEAPKNLKKEEETEVEKLQKELKKLATYVQDKL